MAVSAAVWNKMHRITFITGTLAVQILVHLGEATPHRATRRLAATSTVSDPGAETSPRVLR